MVNLLCEVLIHKGLKLFPFPVMLGLWILSYATDLALKFFIQYFLIEIRYNN